MIFVTGASGLVGSHLVSALVQQGLPVRAFYRSVIPDIAYSEKVEWIKGDILDVVSLEEALQDVREVYHCAAIVSFDPGRRQQLNHTNIEGTANVVNACLDAGVKKLLFVSSVAALGRIRSEPINETMNWSAETSNSAYGKSKYLAEIEVWRGIGEGLDAVIVNPVIILGAGNWNAGSSGIFKSAYNEFPWYTGGVSGFVYVQDVVDAMLRLMRSDISAQRFILSAADLTYQQVFTLIAKGFGKKPPHKKVTPLMAQIVWRLEAVKSFFSGKKPLLTRETSATAQAVVNFDNTKLKAFLPDFKYTPVSEAVEATCKEFTKRYNL